MNAPSSLWEGKCQIGQTIPFMSLGQVLRTAIHACLDLRVRENGPTLAFLFFLHSENAPGLEALRPDEFFEEQQGNQFLQYMKETHNDNVWGEAVIGDASCAYF